MNIDYKKLLPVRNEAGNKSTFGKVTVIAGSKGMAGAAFLCALAVLRSGAGMVRIFTSEDNRIIYQTLLPEALLSVYESEEDLSVKLREALDFADVIAIGPGLGTDKTAIRIVDRVLNYAGTISNKKIKPLVIDADALNVIAQNDLVIPKGACITPHPGEMSRLTGLDVDTIKSDLASCAADFSRKNSITVVLKDHNTVISENGIDPVFNKSGSNALAKAGSGDVLTGTIAGFLSQGAKVFDAAVLGVYIHGLAGEIAAETYTQYGVLARDTANCIPSALKRILK